MNSLEKFIFAMIICQVAEPQVSRLCTEAQECMVMARWFDLVSLMLTSADVILSKVSEKGKILIVHLYVLFF